MKRRILAALAAFLLLCDSVGAAGIGRAGKGAGYAQPKFPAGAQVLFMTYGAADGGATVGGQGTTSVTNSINGGTSAGTNIFAEYADAALIRVRWGAGIERTANTFTWSGVDSQITSLKGFGKKYYILIDTQTYNNAVGQSWLPDDIRNDNGSSCPTYGGTWPHCGETLKNGQTGQYGIIWWNTNVYNRWKALIDSLAAKYKNDSSFGGLMLGESSCSYTSADITAAGGSSGLATIYENQVAYAATALGNKNLVFPNVNFIPGDNGTVAAAVVSWLNSGNYNIGAEFEFPVTQQPQYAKNVGANTAANFDNSGIVNSMRTWPRGAGQKVYLFTDITVQWGVSTGFTSDMAQRIMNYAAYIGADVISFNTVFVGGDTTIPAQCRDGYCGLVGARYLLQ